MANGNSVMQQIFGATSAKIGNSLGVDNSQMFNGLPLEALKQKIGSLMVLPTTMSAAGIVQMNGVAGGTEAKLFLLQRAAKARLRTMTAGAAMHEEYVNFGTSAMRIDERLAASDARMQIEGLKYGIGMGGYTESTDRYKEAMESANMMIDEA